MFSDKDPISVEGTCPYCGNTGNYMEGGSNGGGPEGEPLTYSASVDCNHCGAMGPMSSEASQVDANEVAIVLWMERA